MGENMSTLKHRRQRSTIAAGIATLAMVLGAAAVPAQAASKTSYVALGDSYAAGQGAGPYLDGCFRSENSYAELADQAKKIKLITNAACSGKTTAEIEATQLRRLKKGTELVTITAGGNDLNVGAIAVLCGAALQSPGCQQALASAQSLLSSGELTSRVTRLIRAVAAESPRAKIVVTGYPRLFESAPGLPDQANLVVDALNGSIFLATWGTEAQYVGVTDAFAGHGIGSADPWINYNYDPSVPLNADSFHPNAAGYQGYYAALKTAGVF
jgi:lysophospholipase L1-like esterase